jgi:hypothetical protein
MKYYIYISDAKVDMLFPQVPHDIKKKVALEFKMDLKLLSASRRTETESENNRIAGLETVADFIREYGNIGTVDKHNEYIGGFLQMRWDPFRYGVEEMSVIYFGGETEWTFVGLGCSIHHVTGLRCIASPRSPRNNLRGCGCVVDNFGLENELHVLVLPIRRRLIQSFREQVGTSEEVARGTASEP